MSPITPAAEGSNESRSILLQYSASAGTPCSQRRSRRPHTQSTYRVRLCTWVQHCGESSGHAIRCICRLVTVRPVALRQSSDTSHDLWLVPFSVSASRSNLAPPLKLACTLNRGSDRTTLPPPRPSHGRRRPPPFAPLTGSCRFATGPHCPTPMTGSWAVW